MLRCTAEGVAESEAAMGDFDVEEWLGRGTGTGTVCTGTGTGTLYVASWQHPGAPNGTPVPTKTCRNAERPAALCRREGMYALGVPPAPGLGCGQCTVGVASVDKTYRSRSRSRSGP